MVQHMPPEELLLDYAAGSLPEPLALLVATQMTLSPETRAEVRALESLGGALLEETEPAEMAPHALDSVLARLDEKPRAASVAAGRRAGKAGDAVAEAGSSVGTSSVDDETARLLPAPLRVYLEGRVSDLPWRQRGGQVAECELLPDHAGYRTRLIRIKAGAGVPAHTHAGREYTLVLDGSFSDETGRYARGDVAVADDEVDHQPIAGPERDCICLAVTDAPLKMTGPVGRFLNFFVDM